MDKPSPTPRFVRNFWVELDVPGYKSRVARGPKSSAQGFNLSVKVRNHKLPHRVLEVKGYVNEDFQLCVEVTSQGDCILKRRFQP